MLTLHYWQFKDHLKTWEYLKSDPKKCVTVLHTHHKKKKKQEERCEEGKRECRRRWVTSGLYCRADPLHRVSSCVTCNATTMHHSSGQHWGGCSRSSSQRLHCAAAALLRDLWPAGGAVHEVCLRRVKRQRTPHVFWSPSLKFRNPSLHSSLREISGVVNLVFAPGVSFLHSTTL